MIDPVEQFLKSIDPAKCRVISSPAFILVLGGPVSAQDRYLSVRSMVVDEIARKAVDLASHLLTPEQFPDWLHHAVYSDLLEFEEDLAYLTEVPVLICESAGAICELGSFALIKELARKLLVVVGTEHFESDSFIRLGPIARLEGNYQNSVLVVQSIPRSERAFSSTSDAESISAREVEADLPLIIAEIRRRFSAPPRTEHFDPSNIKHRLLALADAVDLLKLARQKDLKIFAEGLKFPLESGELKRYLFLLESLEIIQSVATGTERFYAPGRHQGPFLDYTASSSSKFERTRVKAHFYQSWEKLDPARIRAMSRRRP